MKNISGYINIELAAWLIALIYLAGINPQAAHFSLCLFNHLGIDWCPGCGIGHSISYLLHGQFKQSFEAHYLGFVALLILLHRIYTLSKNEITKHKLNSDNNI